MKNLKKIIALVCALALLAAFASCGIDDKSKQKITETETPAVSSTADTTTETDVPDTQKFDYTLSVAALNGPTGMGMAKMITDKPTYAAFELFGAADEVKSKLLTGEVDIAAIPANLASVIYNKTEGKYVIAAINTLGVLYVVERGENINSVSDLNGKTVYATGQGSTPEYILNKILSANGTEPTEIVYKSEHSELASLLIAGQADIAVLPQPFVTTVLAKDSSLRIALDLTKEWQNSCEGETVQGVVVVKKETIENHPDEVKAFLNDYKASVEYVNANPTEAGEMIANLGIVASAAIAEEALPYCNIVFIDGDEMEKDLDAFFAVLYEAAPQSVGGKLPDSNIYYKG